MNTKNSYLPQKREQEFKNPNILGDLFAFSLPSHKKKFLIKQLAMQRVYIKKIQEYTNETNNIATMQIPI
ncbi:hypothetical protein LguiB_020909 [Lonicera macranthoides]